EVYHILSLLPSGIGLLDASGSISPLLASAMSRIPSSDPAAYAGIAEKAICPASTSDRNAANTLFLFMLPFLLLGTQTTLLCLPCFFRTLPGVQPLPVPVRSLFRISTTVCLPYSAGDL